MRSWKVVGLAMWGVAAACGEPEESAGARGDDILALTGDAQAGEALYATHCSVCHNADGSGSTGPSLRGESLDGETVAVILQGEDAMPAFGDTFSDQEVADLLAWLDANVFE
ncbi:MAG: Cytochrome oxidase, cbb3-type, subunit [Pseudomonadota bacterium]|jgi:cytochrome c oxidase cbb3-type subunit 3